MVPEPTLLTGTRMIESHNPRPLLITASHVVPSPMTRCRVGDRLDTTVTGLNTTQVVCATPVGTEGNAAQPNNPRFRVSSEPAAQPR